MTLLPDFLLKDRLPLAGRKSGCALVVALAVGLLMTSAPTAWSADAPAQPGEGMTGAGSAAAMISYDGVVQAVRETVVAAQVPGAVVALNVKAGDRVKRGQILLRLDARAADQAAAASAAQVRAARAAQEAATREFERQKQLHQKKYISDAALERAEAQFKSATAGTDAQVATADAALAQSSFYVVRAPYDGVVSAVAIVLGDMAMPGRPLLTMYDPSALRVSVPVPQSLAAKLSKAQPVQVEFPSSISGAVSVSRWELLPTIDPATHSLEMRLPLPAGLMITPGAFARVQLPGEATAQTRTFIPASAIVRRAEMTGVYVIGIDGKPQLRQIRIGRSVGERIEVLSGLGAGERIVPDPQSAVRAR